MAFEVKDDGRSLVCRNCGGAMLPGTLGSFAYSVYTHVICPLEKVVQES